MGVCACAVKVQSDGGGDESEGGKVESVCVPYKSSVVHSVFEILPSLLIDCLLVLEYPTMIAFYFSRFFGGQILAKIKNRSFIGVCWWSTWCCFLMWS